jgi:hypothetical protein
VCEEQKAKEKRRRGKRRSGGRSYAGKDLGDRVGRTVREKE